MEVAARQQGHDLSYGGAWCPATGSFGSWVEWIGVTYRNFVILCAQEFAQVYRYI